MGISAILPASVLLAGCPIFLPVDPVNPEYDAGFLAGFAVDAWYWDGFYDGYDTLTDHPVYYDDSEIPFLDDGSYDAGYWDGVWYAYNDGYFVDYDYAFTIGFSEGYDVAFQAGWRQFLAGDAHVEYDNGGWGDGYNDGFSEGRVFGAYDYDAGLPFDWFDAMLDYRSGTDLVVVDARGRDVGTGVYGPVFLYEYGVNPHLAKVVPAPRAPRTHIPAVRSADGAKAELPGVSYRDLPGDLRADLNVRPDEALRGGAALRLQTTWLQRVEAYRNALDNGKQGHFNRLADD
jgi:hypothetical protein